MMSHSDRHHFSSPCPHHCAVIFGLCKEQVCDRVKISNLWTAVLAQWQCESFEKFTVELGLRRKEDEALLSLHADDYEA